MNPELQTIWKEFIADLGTAAVLWELAVIVIALSLAWLVNGAVRNYVMRTAPASWKLGRGGLNRVIFPLTAFVVVRLGALILANWQHTHLLHLSSKLLLAMAVIRLVVYVLHYIVAPGGLLKKLENTISGLIWALLALHITGLLGDLVQVLEDVKFNIGKHPVDLFLILQALLTILVTIFIALWISRFIENKVMQADQMSMNMRVVLTKLLRIILLGIAVLIALSAVGLDITVLSVFGGALGVGLGFGLQRITSNYVSGFILLLDKSMKIGDLITVDDKHYGVISELRTRYLLLKKLDGTEVIIPNETLIINPVINHSYADRNSRVVLEVQISYESNLEKALEVLKEIAVQHERVIKEPTPSSYIVGFGDSAINLGVTLWIEDPENGQQMLKSEIFLAIWKRFKVEGIVQPYPQREVRILADNAGEATTETVTSSKGT